MFSKASKTSRSQWEKFIAEYLLQRETLMNTFVLIDSRIEPQQIDLEFMGWCGEKGLPFAIIFTKADKLNNSKLAQNVAHYKKELLKNWEELPPIFVSSSETKKGREEVLDYVDEILKSFVIE